MPQVRDSSHGVITSFPDYRFVPAQPRNTAYSCFYLLVDVRYGKSGDFDVNSYMNQGFG